MKENKRKIKLIKFLNWLLFILSVIGSLYVGGWLMFVQPIVEACNHFDAGTFTGVVIGITILKCIFASSVGILIFYAGAFLNDLINIIWDKKDGGKFGNNRKHD